MAERVFEPPPALLEGLGFDLADVPAAAQDERIYGLRREHLPAAAAACLAGGWRFATLVGTDDRDRGLGFGVELVLERPAGPIVRLRTELPADAPAYPSLSKVLPAALWDERELRDLLGIEPAGHPDPRRLVLHDAFPDGFHPLRRDAPTVVPDGVSARPFAPFVASGEGVYQLPVGPIHAGVIEPGHFRFSVIGESILHLDARLFFTHRGIEKLVEGRTIAAALPIVERSCGVCTVTHAAAFSMAVERIAGASVPDRAVALRAVLAELERLYNHVGDLGNMCAGIGFNPGSSGLAWLKERLLRVNESLVGHRYLTGAVVPGGLALVPATSDLAALRESLPALRSEVEELVKLVSRSELVQDRFRGTGHLPRETALALGTLGVAARASGVRTDLRSDRPDGAYLRLDVPCVEAVAGDAAARFDVRAREAIVSLDLLGVLLADLPDGPTYAPVGPVREGASALGWAEGPRGASWLWLRAGPDGRVDRLRLRSASFANWPAVAAAAPGNLVPDFPLINKSFELCYACTDR